MPHQTEARYTMNGPETSNAPIRPVGQIPLSFTQEFLCLFGDGDGDGAETGPFGPRYHGVRGWRLRGKIDIGALQEALGEVVARHEALRTSIVRGGTVSYQDILP